MQLKNFFNIKTWKKTENLKSFYFKKNIENLTFKYH